MSDHKIIFTGPAGAGKTTAITSMSDINIVSTYEQVVDMVRVRESSTAEAMDYGVMNLGGEERLYLYGISGQEGFNSMQDFFDEGGVGLILLLNNNHPDPFKEMHFFLNSFSDFISRTGVAIGITRMDEAMKPTIKDYHKALRVYGHKFPVFNVDPRQRVDVSLLIEALLYSLDPGLGE